MLLSLLLLLVIVVAIPSLSTLSHLINVHFSPFLLVRMVSSKSDLLIPTLQSSFLKASPFPLKQLTILLSSHSAEVTPSIIV